MNNVRRKIHIRVIPFKNKTCSKCPKRNICLLYGFFKDDREVQAECPCCVCLKLPVCQEWCFDRSKLRLRLDSKAVIDDGP